MLKNRFALLLAVIVGFILLTLFVTWIGSLVGNENQVTQTQPEASLTPEAEELAEFERIQPDPELLNPAPSPSPLTIPQTQTMTIGGVVVQNFLTSSRSLDSFGTIEVTDSNDFTILYYPGDESFVITVNNSPFETYRQQAETYLLAALNIPENQACQLTVSISTPSYVNPNEAGTNYPLSFCRENE